MSEGYAGDLLPREAWTHLKERPDAQLVDVRTVAEWTFVGRPNLLTLTKEVRYISWITFPGGQRNPEFENEVERFAESKNQPLLFICRSGQRSRSAAMAMTAIGYTQCYNVAEGFEGDKDAQGHRGISGGWKACAISFI